MVTLAFFWGGGEVDMLMIYFFKRSSRAEKRMRIKCRDREC